MKPFDLEAAKDGAPICTRAGNPAILLRSDLNNEFFPLAVIYTTKGGIEEVAGYTAKGKYYCMEDSDEDLFMSSTKHEGWVNIYFLDYQYSYGNIIFKLESDAIECGRSGNKPYIATVKIEWEDQP